MLTTELGLEMFVNAMEQKLEAKAKEKQDTWVNMELKNLLELLDKEILEFHVAGGPLERAKELVDIANICMMLYNRYCVLWAEDASAPSDGAVAPAQEDADGRDSSPSAEVQPEVGK